MNDDLIRRSALKQDLLEKSFYPAIVKCALETAPAVDAVEVVRCKDCKRSGMYCFGTSSEETFACLDVEEDGFVSMAMSVKPDFYCSHGERR